MFARILSVSVFAGSTLCAQEYRATLTGRVIDPQGGVMPSARVMAVSESTGATSQTLSGPDGVYTIPFLPPGRYNLRAKHPDSRGTYATGPLSTGERVGVDVQM